MTVTRNTKAIQRLAIGALLTTAGAQIGNNGNNGNNDSLVFIAIKFKSAINISCFL